MPPKPTRKPADPLARALKALRAADGDMARAIKLVGPLPDRSRPAGFPALLKIVCQQQLSVASAAAIWNRMEAAIQPLTPARLLSFDDAGLRALGMSGPKIRYSRHLAETLAGGGLDLETLATMEDAAALAALVQIKGIGRWTAEIYLMFALGRPDVWPADDLALQVAVQYLKGLKARPSQKQMDRLAEPWRPHRTVAARILWAYYREVKGRAGLG